MQYVRIATLCLATLPFAAAACGDDDGGGGSSTVAPDQVIEALADTYCHILTQCSTADDDLKFFAIFARGVSASTCRSFMATAQRLDIDIEAKLAAGELVLDGKAYAACLADVRASCDIERMSACAEVIEGKVAIGGACTNDVECAGDAHCQKEDFDCPGVCAARVALGQPCDFEDECSDAAGDADCSFESNTCVTVTRTSNAAAGAACGYTETATAITYVGCASGLSCESDDEGNSTCVAQVASGAACNGDSAMCPGLELCIPTGEETAACGALPLVGAGASCNEDVGSGQPLAVCNIFSRLACIDGTCQAWGNGSVGALCGGVLSLGAACQEGNYCGADNKCAAKKAESAACEDDEECLSEFCTGEGTCAALPVCE